MASGLGFVLRDATLAFRLSYRLGSEGLFKFHTARVPRTRFAAKAFLYLLLKLTVHVEEPYRTRARAQLHSIFDFRQLLFPPMSKSIRCWKLCHGFVQQAADWIHQFCRFAYIIVTCFHRFIVMFRPVVEISNPSLATTTFNYKRWLAEWRPTPSLSCQCASLSGKTAAGHTLLVRPMSLLPTMLALRNLSDTTWPTEEKFFAHMSSQFDRWLHAWGLDDAFLDRWDVFLMQQWQLHRQQEFSSSEQQERRQLRRLVLLPADHAAST